MEIEIEYSNDGKIGSLIDCVILNRRLAGSVQNTRVYMNVAIDL